MILNAELMLFNCNYAWIVWLMQNVMYFSINKLLAAHILYRYFLMSITATYNFYIQKRTLKIDAYR